jgi:ubiquinone/menaquinone biosynthesis C-methylase UbiE
MHHRLHQHRLHQHRLYQHRLHHHTVHLPRAVTEALRVLRSGGRLIILNLLCHDHEAARELYANARCRCAMPMRDADA